MARRQETTTKIPPKTADNIEAEARPHECAGCISTSFIAFSVICVSWTLLKSETRGVSVRKLCGRACVCSRGALTQLNQTSALPAGGLFAPGRFRCCCSGKISPLYICVFSPRLSFASKIACRFSGCAHRGYLFHGDCSCHLPPRTTEV